MQQHDIPTSWKPISWIMWQWIVIIKFYSSKLTLTSCLQFCKERIAHTISFLWCWIFLFSSGTCCIILASIWKSSSILWSFCGLVCLLVILWWLIMTIILLICIILLPQNHLSISMPRKINLFILVIGVLWQLARCFTNRLDAFGKKATPGEVKRGREKG